jgi:biotin-dependent carboxylase-like uncharacterized protein
MIEILAVGLQATLQDLGRPGFGFLGVPQAGAADAASLKLANRLVGNEDGAACVELLLGDLTVRFRTDRAFALAGALCAADLDGRPIPIHQWAYARAGQVLSIGRPVQGLRTYVAMAGGFEAPLSFGSRSTDTLSGIGPAPLRPGTVLTLGEPGSTPHVGHPAASAGTVGPWTRLDVTARLGPRDDLFTEEAIEALRAGPWRISQETDRIAARLLGPTLRTTGIGQLPTEGLAAGSIQVPPSGQPIVHLANHPPTGGYPVIAVVERSDLDRISQAQPGTELHLTFAPRIDLG